MTAEEYRKAQLGNCYEFSYLLFESLSGQLDGNANVRRLCHGICRLTKAPYVEFGHAWIEVTNGRGATYVIDSKFPGKSIERSRYYKIGRVHTVKRYHINDARKLVRERGGYGPWNDRIALAAHATLPESDR